MSTSERRERLSAAIGSQEVYSDHTAEALDGGDVPRYALGTCEDNYPENVNWTVHDSLDELASVATDQANECPAWNVAHDGIVDLDTGNVLSARVWVEVDVDR